jgi:hypothetical protein
MTAVARRRSSQAPAVRPPPPPARGSGLPSSGWASCCGYGRMLGRGAAGREDQARSAQEPRRAPSTPWPGPIGPTDGRAVRYAACSQSSKARSRHGEPSSPGQATSAGHRASTLHRTAAETASREPLTAAVGRDQPHHPPKAPTDANRPPPRGTLADEPPDQDHASVPPSYPYLPAYP